MVYAAKFNGASDFGFVGIDAGFEVRYFQAKDILEVRRIKTDRDLKNAVRDIYLTELDGIVKEPSLET